MQRDGNGSIRLRCVWECDQLHRNYPEQLSIQRGAVRSGPGPLLSESALSLRREGSWFGSANGNRKRLVWFQCFLSSANCFILHSSRYRCTVWFTACRRRMSLRCHNVLEPEPITGS